jgi:radical SAM superfamily enzyme YgiQ (UPF0313 family)
MLNLEHATELASRYGISDSQIREHLYDCNPDVIGVSSMYTQCFSDAHHIAHLADEECPGATVVFGGAHATTLPEIVLKDPNVDVVVIGEGEVTIVELLDHIANGQGYSRVEGIAYRKNGVPVIGQPRPPIEDLDRLSFPAWDILDRDIEEIKADHGKNRYLMRRPMGYMQTSRGCPFNCYFCSFVKASGRAWRARSAKNIVDEMELLINKYGYREIRFADDNCSVSKARMLEICNDIIERKLDVKIATPSGIAINTLDLQVLSRMKKAGFYRLCFGIETGDPVSQKLIDKRVNLDKAIKTISIANRMGFWTAATFIIGHPHEGKNEIRATIEFAKKANLDFAVFLILIPQLGTRAYDSMKQKGLIDLEPSWVEPGHVEWYKIGLFYCNGARTSLFDTRDLQRLRARAYRSFLVHKIITIQTYVNLLRKIRAFEDILYILRMVAIPIQMLANNFLGRYMTYIPQRSKETKLRGKN